MNNDKIIWDDTKITALNYVRQRNLSPEGVTKKKTKKKKNNKTKYFEVGPIIQTTHVFDSCQTSGYN